MISQKRLITLCRWLFGALIVVSFLLAWTIAPKFKIDTDLADVSPVAQNTTETRAAIASLRSSMEQRAILLIQGDDEDKVFDAEDYLRLELSKIAGLTVFDSNQVLLEKVFDDLLEYRFSLLSSEQSSILDSSSATEIAQRAQLKLYKSGAQQLFTFDRDPLGWHSETFFDLLNSSQSGISDTQPESGFAENISFKINEGALSLKIQENVSKKLELLITDVRNNYGVRLDTSGVFFFAASAAKSAKADIKLISIGSGLGVILLLLLAFRSLWSLVLPLTSIAIGVAFAFLLTHSIYGQVHILTLVFGASLIGIVIDYSLHYFYHRSGDSHLQLAGETASRDEDHVNNRALHRALLLSLGTSLIGYGALSFSSLVALQKVALFSCCGLLMAWLSVVCFGGWATGKPLRLNQQLFAKLVHGLKTGVRLVSARCWIGFAILIVLLAATLIAVVTPFNDDPRVFFTSSDELISSERRVAAVTNDYEPGRYLIVYGDSRSQVYERYQELMRLVAIDPVIDASNLSSLLSWIPSPDIQNENYQRYAKLYAVGAAADVLGQTLGTDSSSMQKVRAEYFNSSHKVLDPSIVSTLMGEALPPFWIEFSGNDKGSSFVNFVLIRKGVNADSLSMLCADISGVEYVNTLQRTRDSLTEQRQSAIGMLFVAYLLIAILVLIRYQKLNALWMVVVPICASASFVVTCVLVGVSLNLFHVMALFLVLGFGMDYTIFTKEMSGQDKFQQDLSLQAILLSALTSLLSFGLLGLSSMPVVASFGLTLLLGNLFNLIGIFVASNILNSTAK